MRNTKAQREDIMIRVSVSQQPSKSHVSHAEIGGRFICEKSAGNRCDARSSVRQLVEESGCAAVPVWKILPKPSFG